MNDWTVSSIFDCMSGNSGLTEEFIYTKMAIDDVLYEVLSSATTGPARMGYIPRCVLDNGRPLKTFEGKPGILVARNGKAGHMAYLEPGKYTINDHAYILSLAKGFKEVASITNLSAERNFLLWFICTHQSLLYSFSSRNDNATWNKSSFLKASIYIPAQDKIDEIASLYEETLYAMSTAQQVIDRLNALLSKQIDQMPEFRDGLVEDQRSFDK